MYSTIAGRNLQIEKLIEICQGLICHYNEGRRHYTVHDSLLSLIIHSGIFIMQGLIVVAQVQVIITVLHLV